MSPKRYINENHDSTSEDEAYDPSYQPDYETSEGSPRRQFQNATVNNSEGVRKRGRGTSKRPCLNRNALMARENRRRKKEYLQKVENKLSYYHQQNKNLTTIVQKQDIDIKRLKGEVAYLKSILNNNTTITTLLKSLNDGLKQCKGSSNNLTYSSGASRASSTGIPSDTPSMPSSTTSELSTKEHEDLIQTNNQSNFNVMFESEGNLLEDKSPKEYPRRHAYNSKGFKLPATRKTGYSFSDLDHTYTIPRDDRIEEGLEFQKGIESQGILRPPTNSKINKALIDLAEIKQQNDLNSILPVTDNDISQLDEKMDIELLDTGINDLLSFDMDIFNDVTNFDHGIDPLDLIQDPPNNVENDNSLGNLDNTGICLHVNSGKVSLEFCSSCHLNSVNSELE